jgi:hypothetical protein
MKPLSKYNGEGGGNIALRVARDSKYPPIKSKKAATGGFW